MKRWLIVFASIAFALLSTACFDPRFKYSQVETRLRHVVEDDTLFVLETEHGIDSVVSGRPQDEFRKIVLENGRMYPAYGGLVDLNFDSIVAKLSEKKPSELSENDRAMLEFAQGISVEKVWLVWSNRHGLSLYRLWRFPKITRGLASLNDFFNRSIREGTARNEAFRGRFPTYDEESFRMFAAHAERNDPWIRLSSTSIEIEFPMTPRAAARCLAQLMGSANQPDDQGTAPFFASVKALEVAKDRVLLRLEPEADGWYQFQSKTEKPRRDHASADAPPGFSFVAAPTPAEIEQLVKQH